MNNQRVAFGLSFLIHAAVIVVVLSMSHFIPMERKPLVIDLSIGDKGVQQPMVGSRQTDRINEKPLSVKQMPSPLRQAQGERQTAHAEPVEALQSQMPLAETKEHLQEESPVSFPVEEKPVKTTETMVGWALPTGNWRAQPALPFEGEEGGGGSPGTGDAAGSGKKGATLESAKNQYLKEHFAYIRDVIMKNLSYPPTARRMGWEGKVVVSFVVNEDGHVSDIKVIESSGFGILDRNAVEMVKKSSPFPKPPIRAELVMPIVYKII